MTMPAAESIFWFSHSIGGQNRGVIREAIVPGFDAEIPVKVAALKNLTINEVGQAQKDALTVAALLAGEGDPEVTQTVKTRLYGDYQNCYKLRVELWPEIATEAGQLPGTGGGRVNYKITFKQVSPNSE